MPTCRFCSTRSARRGPILILPSKFPTSNFQHPTLTTGILPRAAAIRTGP